MIDTQILSYLQVNFYSTLVPDYFENIITGHYYWGHAGGQVTDWLYHPVHSKWHAFRWQRVFELFKVRYNQEPYMIIDECGNFDSGKYPDLTEQLLYYGERTLSDNMILAVTPFLFHDPSNSPGNVPNAWWQPNSDRYGMDDTQLAIHQDRLRNFFVEVGEPEPPIEPEPECDCQPLGYVPGMRDDLFGIKDSFGRVGDEVEKLTKIC